MSLMYKPGDKVMVRPDLSSLEIYRMKSGQQNGRHTYNVVDQMVDQAGKIFTIRGVRETEFGYTLEEYGYSWTDEMFLPADQNECFCESLL